MRFIKTFAFLFIGCIVLFGCGNQNKINNNGNDKTKMHDEKSVDEENKKIDDTELTDAINNSNISCGTIASNEQNTRIDFFVMEDKIDVSGKYNGEIFEKILTDDKMIAFLNELADYSPTVQKKEYDYWPHTDEYPEMYVLFDYNILFDNKYEYKMDGAECYPDGWDEFIKKIVEIIGL